MKRPRAGPLQHGLAVQLALAMLSTGKAKTKAEAAAMAGIGPQNLTPSCLRKFADANPVGRKLAAAQPNLNFLDITADVAGKRVSARDALSSSIEASIRVIAKHGPRIGRLTKAQRAHLLDAKRMIDLARTSGLFSPIPQANLPSELGAEMPESAPDSDPVVGSLSDFVEDQVLSTEDEALAPGLQG